jgi:hypothetical protein
MAAMTRWLLVAICFTTHAVPLAAAERAGQTRTRVLTDAELEQARRLIPSGLSGADLIATQSFLVDGRKWIVGYVLPAPGGKNKSGEIGFLVIRDGRLIQAPHVDSSSYAKAIKATAFLDANHDGLLDVALLVQIANRPNQAGFTDAWILLARPDDRYEYDRKLSIAAGGTGTTPLRSISDVKANLRSAEEPEVPPTPTHKYSLDGFMRGKNKKCKGEAAMDAWQDDDKAPCLDWTLTNVKCRGKGEVDWVHNEPADPNGSSESICFKDGQWTFVSDPQNCDVVVNREVNEMPANVSPAKASFMLDCTWPCRGGNRSKCDGGASYDFVPLSAAPASKK